MPTERDTPAQIMERMIDFGRVLPNEGVNNFVIEGPISQADRLVTVAAGLFPPIHAFARPTYAIVTVEPEERGKMPQYHSRILHLSLSKRIKQLKIEDDPEIRAFMTNICRRKGWPITMIAFGTYRDSDLSFVTLHGIWGMSPQTALREFQAKSMDRLITIQ